MAVMSKSVLSKAKEMIGDDFRKEDIAKVLQLIYNAGYRKGRKDQHEDSPTPEYLGVD